MTDSDNTKYLAIKNWHKFQPKDSKTLPWIRDYKDREADPEYHSLTMPQRYMLDAICRLRGRYGRNLTNDPLWICRATAVQPRERHNATTAISVLLERGFLILVSEEKTTTEVQQTHNGHTADIQQQYNSNTTDIPLTHNSEELPLCNQQNGLLGKDSIGKERVGKDRKQQENECAQKEQDDLFLKAYDQYPRHTGKPAAEKAWNKALKKGHEADFIYQQIMHYSQVCFKYHKPKEYTPHMATWMNDERFMDDPSEWAASESKGNGNGHSKSEQHREETELAVAAGVEKFLRGKNEMGDKYVSASVAANGRNSG